MVLLSGLTSYMDTCPQHNEGRNLFVFFSIWKQGWCGHTGCLIWYYMHVDVLPHGFFSPLASSPGCSYLFRTQQLKSGHVTQIISSLLHWPQWPVSTHAMLVVNPIDFTCVWRFLKLGSRVDTVILLHLAGIEVDAGAPDTSHISLIWIVTMIFPTRKFLSVMWASFASFWD